MSRLCLPVLINAAVRNAIAASVFNNLPYEASFDTNHLFCLLKGIIMRIKLLHCIKTLNIANPSFRLILTKYTCIVFLTSRKLFSDSHYKIMLRTKYSSNWIEKIQNFHSTKEKREKEMKSLCHYILSNQRKGGVNDRFLEHWNLPVEPSIYSFIYDEKALFIRDALYFKFSEIFRAPFSEKVPGNMNVEIQFLLIMISLILNHSF